jgi:hypothetical protein
MRQFEYRILTTSDLSEVALNALGKEGWEVACSTQSIMYGSCLVLKRERPGGVEPSGKRDE